MIDEQLNEITETVEKLEVLSEIYIDLGGKTYPTKKEMELSKLKMQLVKKEMLLLNYMINQTLFVSD